jgi:phosphoglycolate phosphatase
MEAVEALKSLGYKRRRSAPTSPRRLADQLLRELGILDAFGALIGADTLPVRKPDPEPLREAVRTRRRPA